jgi:NAD(P)-dependent dehydrogenase (short-subunit alcohol dehydrogenase family)
MINLKNKHILICGGSRGIGAATSKIAASLGAKVSINYLSNTLAAKNIVNEIKNQGGKAESFQADISKESEAMALVKKATDLHGDINGLVIAAGIFEGALLNDMTGEFWDKVLQVNLKSTFLAVKASQPSMIKAGGGSIVIYASTAGQRGSDTFSAYAVSKGGQLIFMKSMARELAKYKIRTNCVAPGWTETEMATNKINEFGREDIIKSIPLNRIGLPEDAANAAIFLLSDSAPFITGSTITVDGGADMRG